MYIVKYIVFSFLFSVSSVSFSQRKVTNDSFQVNTFHSYFHEKVFDEISSEETDPLSVFLSLDPTMSNEKFSRYKNGFEKFCQKLEEKTPKRMDKYLKNIFNEVHKEYLKEYHLNSPLFRTFESGEYDCVSGTALYALVLHTLGIPYIIKETKFHVYLLVWADNRTFLFESTDPASGFISNPIKIDESEKKYLEAGDNGKKYYVFKGTINEKINLQQLSALEYYNMGIASFNDKQILASLDFFEKALKLYDSSRIEEIFKITLEVLEREALFTKSIGLANRYRYYSKVIED